MFEVKRVNGRDENGTTYDRITQIDGEGITFRAQALRRIARDLNFAEGAQAGTCCDVFENGEKIARVYRDGGIDYVR